MFQALGSICKLLPWQQYYAILQFYLSKMKRLVEFQKQLVKIVKTILDSFHFDLSRAAEIKRNPNGKIRKKKNTSNSSDVNSVTEENAGDDTLDDPSKIEDDTAEETVTETGNENEVPEKETNEEDESNEGDEPKDEDLEKLERELAVNISEEPENVCVNEEAEVEPIVNRLSVLQPMEASKIIHTIVSNLLPQLRATIAERSLTDKFHKSNKKNAGPDRDEEDILRIPLALTITQLLQKLPEKLLRANIPGIFMKLCMFLTSRLESVRRATRQTLQQIILSLGPEYLETLITEMISLLTKGFHVYVLVHTLHSVLVAVQPLLKAGDIDRCLPLILKVCMEDVFGSIAEGKESAQVQGKWVEARGNRSYDVFHILGEFISQKCLINLILPLKEVSSP